MSRGKTTLFTREHYRGRGLVGVSLVTWFSNRLNFSYMTNDQSRINFLLHELFSFSFSGQTDGRQENPPFQEFMLQAEKSGKMLKRWKEIFSGIFIYIFWIFLPFYVWISEEENWGTLAHFLKVSKLKL